MSSPGRTDAASGASAVERAHGLQQRAVAANLAGRPAEGARLVLRGLRVLDLTPATIPATWAERERAYVTARLVATLAKSTVETEGLEPALALMDRADAVAGQIDDPTLTAFLHSQRGLILFRGGRLGAARELLDLAAAQIPDTAGVDKWRVLVNRGALFVESGEVVLARRDLSHSVQIARAHGLTQAERIALHNLGCLELIAGDLPRALRLMQEGMELDGTTQQGIAHLDRSRVLLAAGLPAEADAALAVAADLFRRDRCWQDLAEVTLTRAEVALFTGRTAEARLLAGRARDRFRRHGNDRWRRTAELALLHADHLAGRPAGRLVPPARRLAAESAEAGVGQQQRAALLLAAELELERGRPADADALLASVGPAAHTDPIAVRLHHRLVTAMSLERAGQVPRARRTIAHGLRDLAAYQAQFGGIDLQSASAVHGRRLTQQDLDLAMRSGRPGAVLAAVERSRAVTGRIRAVTPPADETTAELLAELRRASDADAPRPEIAELQARLRARSWLNSGSRAWQPPTRLRALRAAAAEDGCHLVTITEVRGRLGAVVIAPDHSPRLVRLTDGDTVRSWQQRLSADLDVLANAGLPAALRTTVTRSLRHSTTELGALLVEALPDDDRPIVLSPTSGLLALPWSLLPRLAGRPVTVAPSLSGWHRARSRLTGLDPGWSVTAVAGPGLTRSQEEAAEVSRAWRGVAATRELAAATPVDVLDAMATSRLVHVAAHGAHHSENPMFSALTLTGGPLFAYELDQRGTLPEHVVLSACDAGRTTVRAEETLGLTSVLLQLGTSAVVAGVARVHDDAAAAIMRAYHVTLARGRTAPEALAEVADQGGTPSPFVCFGSAWRA